MIRTVVEWTIERAAGALIAVVGRAIDAAQLDR